MSSTTSTSTSTSTEFRMSSSGFQLVDNDNDNDNVNVNVNGHDPEDPTSGNSLEGKAHAQLLLSPYASEIDSEQWNLHLMAEGLLLEVDQALVSSSGAAHPTSTQDDLLRLVEDFRTQADEIVDGHETFRHSVESKKRAILDALESSSSSSSSSSSAFHHQWIQTEFQTSQVWNGKSVRTVLYLSDIHEGIQQLENMAKSRSSSSSLSSSLLTTTSTTWVAPSAFERSTTKYWVDESKLDTLLLACAAQVPLLVYGHSGRLSTTIDKASSNFDDVASPISSIYFDSPTTMCLYNDRIARIEEAQLFRVRWYGPQPQGDGKIFLELKTHHEKWTMDSSIKERVTIQEKHMALFLQPDVLWTVSDDVPKKIVTTANPKLHGNELNDAIELLVKMKKLVTSRNLKPCVRTVYSRVAFQSSSSNSLRLTLDRNIHVTDETAAPEGLWYSPASTSSKIIKSFPHPVFEVKLSGSDMPPAIDAMIDDGVIQAAEKFSKFLTGVSVHHPDKVKTLPYWADHPSFRSLYPQSGDDNATKQSSKAKRVDKEPPRSLMSFSSSILSNVPERATTKGVQIIDETEFTGSSSSNADRTSIASTRGSKMQQSRLGWGMFRRNNRGHKIAAKRPARVEPKSYFANERTFIQWLSASLWLVTIAALLLEKEAGGVSHLTTAGLALSSGALVVAAYATYVYMRRIRLLQSGSSRGYVDHIAPLLLACAVIIGVAVLLSEEAKKTKTMSSSGTVQGVQSSGYLHEEDGQCFLHPNDGINRLSYQPSDVAIDNKHDSLLVPSSSKIMAHRKSLNDVKELVNIPATDLEGLVVVGDTIFALSERDGANTLGCILELAWEGDILQVVRKWNVDEADPEQVGEGLAYIEDSNGAKSLAIEVRGRVNLYALPPPSPAPPAGSSVIPTGTLVKRDSLNKKLLQDGLDNGRISAMFGFGRHLFVLHDNDGVLRAWDVERGEMIAESGLPTTARYGKQWEGVAIERRINDDSFPTLSSPSSTMPSTMLRGSVPKSIMASSSDLIVHLAMDTPPQVWSFAVKEGDHGELIFPDCAGVVPPPPSSPSDVS